MKSSTIEYLMPSLETELPKQMMKLSRHDMSIAIQYLSGHNFLLHHEKTITRGEDRTKFLNSKCRLCNREEETTQHMIFHCDALAVKRADTLGKYFLNQKRINLTYTISLNSSSQPTSRAIPSLKVILTI